MDIGLSHRKTIEKPEKLSELLRHVSDGAGEKITLGQIANAIQLIVQLQRGADGKRKVTSIAEVTGMEGDIIQLQEIFKWTRTGTGADGTIEGNFHATGVRPRFLAHLQNQGVKIPGNYFDPTQPL